MGGETKKILYGGSKHIYDGWKDQKQTQNNQW